MTTKSAQVAEIIERRYLCQAMPYGALRGIAAEVGCTSELVRQIARRRGFGHIWKKDTKYLCSRCGEKRGPGSRNGLCRNCLRVTLPCASCGASVTRSAARFAGAMHKINPIVGEDDTAEYVGRVFCNRSCWATWSAKNFGWGTSYQEQMTDAQREIARMHA